jgi:four helix bundle protein
MYSFEELEVWKEARQLRIDVRKLVGSFPAEEKYRLIDQLLRASRSVTANIAEGNGRFHYQENIRFCRQARGSLYEILDHLICAQDEKYKTPIPESPDTLIP